MQRRIPWNSFNPVIGVCLWVAVVGISGAPARAQFHDGSNMIFGKNRVQYRDFVWSYYPLETGFEVYHYQGGQELAQRVVRMLPRVQKDIETLLDRSLDPPIQILVYNKQSEFRQSNIGASQGEDVNIGGTATLIDGKLFLYGTGNTADLERQLRQGLTRILFDQILFGGSWQDALRNSSILQFPDWFKEGLFSYASIPESAAWNAALGDDARRGAFGRIEQADDDEMRRLGHGVWKFVADIFGEPTVANVIYMSRVSRSIESGFLFAIGMDLSELLEETAAYHSEGVAKWESDLPPLSTRKDRRLAKRDGGDLPEKLRRHLKYQRVAMHPDGTKAAMATEERGQLRVWWVDFASGKTRCIAKHGAKIDRIQDDTFPVFAWHPNGRILTYTLEQRGRAFLVNVDLETGESVEKELFRIDKVLSMDYAPDGRTIAFSGVREGRSDLYLYQVIGNTQAPIWEDAWDDLHPHFLPDGDRIAFASNRPNDSWPEARQEPAMPSDKSKDIFVLDLAQDQPQLTQWTATAFVDEVWPQPWTENRVVFLRESNASHRQRHVLAWRDSAVAAIDTTIHYRYFTEEQLFSDVKWAVQNVEWLPTTGQVASTHQHAGHLYWELNDAPRNEMEGATLDLNNGKREEVLPNWRWVPGTGEVDVRDYVFGALVSNNPVQKARPSAPVQTDTESDQDLPAVPLPKPRNYRMNYALEAVTSQLDNTFGGAFYQVYNGVTSVQPGLGALTKVSATDLFEDRRFIAGFRLAGSLENSTYAIGYSDLSRRVDRSFSLERQGQQQFTANGQSLIETHIHTLRHRWSYPFDEVRSLRLNAVYRLDRNAYLAIDAFNLAKNTTFNNAVGLELSYVFDATRERTLNIREGRRSKVWAEMYVNPAEQSKTFGTVGFDFRKYVPIYGDFIFAMRASADISIGSDRLLHLLGGVDNALALSQNTGTPIDPNINYAYQTRITPLRGFSTNARNGSHMALVNAELRLPLISTFVRKPIKSDFVRHFQVVGFLDCGTAWNGLHPYSMDNTFNQTSVEQNPITVTIDNNREPVIGATGFGMRSRVLGYWLRADWGWGVDNGRWQKRIFSLAFSMDF
ncbi:MAG: hypothetical protein ACPGYK_01140 [Flavobacteriales bacterium]